jgi:hypothetical protein
MDWIGYRWLLAHFGVTTTQPLRVETRIAATRASIWDGSTEKRAVPEALRPEANPAAQLAFALKHEGVHLEALSRLFNVMDRHELAAWIRTEPTGQYAKRAGFLFETLTGASLDAPDAGGPYVSALDPKRELTRPHPARNPRWRVRDNLLGPPSFCPQVFLIPGVSEALSLDIPTLISGLERQFGADLIMRSAVWLTLKESRASFAIEHEQDQPDRIHRFAAAIGRLTGTLPDPFSTASLDQLQREILGAHALHYGVRKSPVFVGESGAYGEERVHYIAPHWNDAAPMLAGIRELDTRSVGLSAVARAALLSFGFVYLHPMVDGNGRISRFLINDVLRRDAVLPAPYIIPISTVLQKPEFRPLSYDAILEVFSRPLMQQYRGQWSLGAEERAEDGIRYNLHFQKYADALHAWKYIDLTQHVVFMASAIRETVEHEMRDEAQLLQMLYRARSSLKEIIEGPDAVLDRIIRSIRQMHGDISGKLKGEYPQLADPAVGQAVIDIIKDTFPWEETPR